MKKAVFFVLGFAISNAVIASPHKCEINGKVTFQDAPCAGEVKTNEQTSENGARELFDKVFIDELVVKHGQPRGENTPVLFEVTATNNTKNKIQLILRYDGLDEDGLVVDTEMLVGNIDNNSTKKIKNGLLSMTKRTAILNKIVKWRFNSWKSTIN